MFFKSNAGFMIMMAAAASIGLVSMRDLMRQYMPLHYGIDYGGGGMDYGRIYEIHKKNQRYKIRRRMRRG
jgi:hypothetical protein